ncbi:hypothetical protein, partial [Mycoplasmopsis bovis]|uniref:hypothetical protein n=1 Tax=Mycoplasmopsis bovis TaxID=28903 RepID=UPI003D2A41F0
NFCSAASNSFLPKAGFSSFEWIISFWALIESSIFLSAELNSNSLEWFNFDVNEYLKLNHSNELEWFNFRYSLTSKL